MAIKKIRIILFFLLLWLSAAIHTAPSLEHTQTLQIYTNFKEIIGKPSWLLIIRDVNTGLVTPYLFEINNNDNFWLAFTYGHFYKIIASTLTFAGCAEISNFCNLEDGVISGKSLYMTLSGVLTPDVNTLKCNATQYANNKFTIVKKNEIIK